MFKLLPIGKSKDRLPAGSANVKKTNVDLDNDVDPWGLKVLAPGSDPLVDVIAVHGLNGHREHSFTHKNGTLWLRDLLPVVLPRARIVTYGYNARTHGALANSHMSLRSHGIALSQHLLRARSGSEGASERRPIIFIAHNVGGIIVKHALVYCDSVKPDHNELFKTITLSTSGVFFFGTPHTGQNGTELYRALISISRIFGNANDNIVKHLQHDSEYLYDLGQQYLPISGAFESVFFFEALESSIMGRSMILVPQHSAVISGVQRSSEVALNKNHTNMVKYGSEEDSDYQAVLWHLYKMVREASGWIKLNGDQQETSMPSSSRSVTENGPSIQSNLNTPNGEPKLEGDPHGHVLPRPVVANAQPEVLLVHPPQVVAEAELEPESPSSITAKGLQAAAFNKEGKYAQATVLYEQVLVARQKALGPEHTHTLWVKGDLATCYTKQGKHAQAEQLFAEMLIVREKLLGSEHSHTIWVKGDLAGCYMKLGKYTEAEKLYAEILAVRERVLGPEHQRTLWSKGDLAACYRKQGKKEEGQPM